VCHRLTTGVDMPYSGRLPFLLLLAATSKSAQLGRHAWLTDAMEGPTPVSALLHAATMVTAGVLRLVKTHAVLARTPSALLAMALGGAATARYASMSARGHSDLKKTIARSTCSQLGYMVAALGLGHPDAAFRHRLSHAWFKALRFLAAGVVIHAL
jgi:NADH-quinone oxidoreductase subunit L